MGMRIGPQISRIDADSGCWRWCGGRGCVVSLVSSGIVTIRAEARGSSGGDVDQLADVAVGVAGVNISPGVDRAAGIAHAHARGLGGEARGKGAVVEGDSVVPVGLREDGA